MAKLIYSMITSLDGFVADENGNFDWAEPDEQVHTFVNELERSVGTYLYGRRMYDVMLFWETLDGATEAPTYIHEYAEVWRSADKVVYSTTLEQASSERTRIEREFKPEIVRSLKASATGDISVGGPNLAAQALKAGLVDECNVFVAPVIVGKGNRATPADLFLRLDLLEERRFDNGIVYLRYAAA